MEGLDFAVSPALNFSMTSYFLTRQSFFSQVYGFYALQCECVRVQLCVRVIFFIFFGCAAIFY